MSYEVRELEPDLEEEAVGRLPFLPNLPKRVVPARPPARLPASSGACLPV